MRVDVDRSVRFHRLVVAWVYIVFGLVGLGIGFLLFALYVGLGAAGGIEAMERGKGWADVAGGGVVAGIGFALGGIFAAISLPNLCAGYGLIRRRAWARPFSGGLAVLHLFFAPIGTIFGAYAIWALFLTEEAETSNLREPAPPPSEQHHQRWRKLNKWLPRAIVASAFAMTLTAATVLQAPITAWLGGQTNTGVLAVFLWLLALAFGGVYLHGRRQILASERAEHEHLMIRLLGAPQGVTALQAARVTGLSVSRCEALLGGLVRQRHAQLDIDDDGKQIYRAN
ncbi:hypothetical protein [Pendulispora albinea]|uniref:HTH marR-type domain-containing protein n=1 Tax=Pendulispora albinea TaxID=2741071 RepID=A0ABZ2LQN2_9BACT